MPLLTFSSACGHKLPSFQRILLPSRGNFSAHSSPLAIIVGNPFTVAPLMIAFLLLVGHVLLPKSVFKALYKFIADLAIVRSKRLMIYSWLSSYQ